jgi:two-component system, LytTR family, sensor histidine kinase AlgZ
MIPFLASGRRLLLYLAAWIPIAGLLVYLFANPGLFGAGAGPLSWRESVVVVVPLCEFYALLCLSAAYVCRAFPLHSAMPAPLIASHLGAAVVSSALLVALGRSWAAMLERWASMNGLSSRFDGQLGLLFGAGVLLYLLSVAVHYAFIAAEESRQAREGAQQARMLASEAELRALKAQINPHFLFNSLNSISALTTADPKRAREMCILLSDFLRSTLGMGEKPTIPLREELAMLENYLAIERVRFGERLQFHEEVDPASRNMMVPALLLQPLVENAVKHGVSSLLEGGEIRLTAHRSEELLRVAVENDFDPDVPRQRKNGMGLVNVRKRLDARYGEAARMRVDVEGRKYRVEITFPGSAREGAGSA